MPDGVTVQGPDGKTYQFPAGTDKQAAISYFKKKGIGASPESQRPDAVKQAQVSVAKPLTQAQPTERAMQQGIGGPPMFVDVPSGEGKKFEEAGKKGYAQGGKTGMEMVGSTIGAEGGAGVKGIAGFLMRMLGSGAGAELVI